MVHAALRAYLWNEKPYDERAKREVWTLNGATYEGFRAYICKVKEEGFPAEPRSPMDDLALARLPTTQSEAVEVPGAGGGGGGGGELRQGEQQQRQCGHDARPQHASADLPAAAEAAQQRGQQGSDGGGGGGDDGGGGGSGGPPYTLRHIFDVANNSAVSVVRFAPGSADVLAWGDASGTIYVATAADPPRLLQVLERHSERAVDLDWSPDGVTLLTCSLDGTACLWRPEGGALVRTFRHPAGALTCCRFHPDNPNLLLLGSATGDLLAVNASTGHLAAKCRLPDSPKSAVGACCLQAAGPPGLLLVADSRGCLHLISAALRSGVLPGLAPVAHFPPPGGRYHEPACLEYVAHSALARGPAVLLVLSSGEITLSRLHAKPWRLEAKREVRSAQASAKVRASLRPAVAAEQPELLLCGSEDCRVHLVDISRKSEPPRLVAALAAHRAPVLGVAWSEDETRLASSDSRGAVAVWTQAAAAATAEDAARTRSGVVQQ